jgi:hypothetical protein
MLKGLQVLIRGLSGMLASSIESSAEITADIS